MKVVIINVLKHTGLLSLLITCLFTWHISNPVGLSTLTSCSTIVDSTEVIDGYIEYEETNDLRYLVYHSEDYAIDEANAEDIRTIAVDYSRDDQKQVIIHHVPVGSARIRVSEVRSLLERFGVPNDDIHSIESHEYPLATDTVLMIITQKIMRDKAKQSYTSVKT